MKPIAVIILNWNGEKLLSDFLPTVIATTPAAIADVIVADNGSTDGSLRLLSERFPEVKVLAFKENYGFAGGYNKAIEETGYRWTVLLNSDVETTPGWLEPLWQKACDDPGVVAMQPKILSWREKDRFEYAGAAGGLIDRNGYPYCRGRLMDRVEKDLGQYDTEAEIFWASGACLMVNTEAYRAVGGLDERFFAHMEEIDLCWRLLLDGGRIMYIPGSKVYHVGGASLDAGNPRKTYLNFRNNLLMLHKNLPESDSRPFLLRRRLLDTLAWARYVATLKWGHAGAIVKAHRDFACMKKDYPTHPERNLLKERPDTHRNILLDRYLKKP